MMNKPTPVTEDQRLVLETARDHPDATPKEVATLTGKEYITTEYAERIMHDFELESESTKLAMKDMAMVTKKQDTDDSTDAGEWPFDLELAERSRKYETLTDGQKEIIDTIRENPDETTVFIGSESGRGSSNVRGYVRRFHHLLPDDSDIVDFHGKPEDEEWEDIDEHIRDMITYIHNNPNVSQEGVRKWMNRQHPDRDTTLTTVNGILQEYVHLLPLKFAKRYKALKPGGDKAISEIDYAGGGHTRQRSDGVVNEEISEAAAPDTDESEGGDIGTEVEKALEAIREELDGNGSNVEHEPHNLPLLESIEERILDEAEFHEDVDGLGMYVHGLRRSAQLIETEIKSLRD